MPLLLPLLLQEPHLQQQQPQLQLMAIPSAHSDRLFVISIHPLLELKRVMLIVHLLLRRQQAVQVVGVVVVVLLHLIFQAEEGEGVVHLFLVVEAVAEELMIVMVVQEEVGVVVVRLELNVQVEEVVVGAVPRVLSDLLAVVVGEEGEQLEGPMMSIWVELQEVVVRVYDDL